MFTTPASPPPHPTTIYNGWFSTLNLRIQILYFNVCCIWVTIRIIIYNYFCLAEISLWRNIKQMLQVFTPTYTANPATQVQWNTTPFPPIARISDLDGVQFQLFFKLQNIQGWNFCHFKENPNLKKNQNAIKNTQGQCIYRKIIQILQRLRNAWTSYNSVPHLLSQHSS